MPVPVPLHTAQLKADLRRGVPKFGTFLMSRSTAVAVTLAHSGYDWLLIDAQHAPYTSAEVAEHITAIRSSHLLKQQQDGNYGSNYHALTILVRVSSYQDRAGIQFALDSGADGVLIPYINNKEELEQAVSVCYYPFQNTGDDSGDWGSNAEYPTHQVQGTRSFAFPINGGVALGMQPYLNHSKRNMLIAFQVETQSCIDNLDEILKVKGVDMAFLGPYDQCLSSGIYDSVGAGKMLDSPQLDKLLETLAEKTKAAGILLGVYLGGGTARIEKYLKLGFNFISIGSDLDALTTCATERLRAVPAITKAVGGAAASYTLPPSNNL